MLGQRTIQPPPDLPLHNGEGEANSTASAVPRRNALASLILIAVLLEALFVLLAFVRDWSSSIPTFLGLYLSAFALYSTAAVITLNKRFNSVPNLTGIVLAAAILFRFTLVWCPPTLSEDFYRYLWDGKTQLGGFGPYDYAPRATELQHLRDENYDHINHKEFKTPYPPAAQNLFRVLATLLPGSVPFKLGILLFDILLLEVLRRLLTKTGKNPALLLLYAWHPLPIVEFAGSGHVDIVSISLMMTTVLLLFTEIANTNRLRFEQLSTGIRSGIVQAIAGVLFAFAVCTKYLPMLAFAWLLKKANWKFVAIFFVTAAALMLQFYTEDLRMFHGIFVFYKKWRFNDSLFGILYNLLGGAEPARRVGVVIVGAMALFCFISKVNFFRSMMLLIGAVILLSPVVHPWYVCWIIPFLPFHPNRAWLFFSGWVGVAYLIRFLYPYGVWRPELWLKLLVYVPFYFLLVADVVKNISFRKPAVAEP